MEKGDSKVWEEGLWEAVGARRGEGVASFGEGGWVEV